MSGEKDVAPDSVDVHFEPVVQLPTVELITLEDDETELLKLRAKLFRYDTTVEPPEWKERGTGDAKILKHNEHGTCRFLMRRDKTLKICGNHRLLPHMELKPNCGSDRAWVWSSPADFADEEPKAELFAIRFANAENAQKFKDSFDEAKRKIADGENGKAKDAGEKEEEEASSSDDNDAGDVAEKLNELKIKDASVTNTDKPKETGEVKKVEENEGTAER